MIFRLCATRILFITAALSTVVGGAASGSADTFKSIILPTGTQGDVVHVRLEGQDRALRLYGVACPVTGQPMADSATTHILEAAMETQVTVEIVGEDSAGLPVAKIGLMDGTSLNEQLVRLGLAWWDAPNAPEARNIQKAATEAIAAGRGLWGTPAPLAPWDYRASHGLESIGYKKDKAEQRSSETTTARPVAVIPSLKARGDDDDDDDDGEKEDADGDDEDDDNDDYFPDDPAEHVALMLKHQPHIAFDKTGKPLGLTATDIASVPGAGRIGLQNGDIISSVNGIALTSEAQILGLVTQLQGAKQLELTVMRGGKPTQITIPLE